MHAKNYFAVNVLRVAMVKLRGSPALGDLEAHLRWKRIHIHKFECEPVQGPAHFNKMIIRYPIHVSKCIRGTQRIFHP